MKSTKFYKVLSIVLLLINIGTLSYFYVTRPEHPPRPGEPHLAEEIGLEGDAKKKVDALEIAHHKDKRKLMKRDIMLHEKLYQQLGDSAAADILLAEIHQNRIELERMTYDFFNKAATYCNSEQRKKLKQQISDHLRMIFGHPPKRKH